jgi:hypothetical protein
MYTFQLPLNLVKIPPLYAAIMEMNKDQKLVGNNFSNVATALFVTTVTTEVPTGKSSFLSHLSHTNHSLHV